MGIDDGKPDSFGVDLIAPSQGLLGGQRCLGSDCLENAAILSDYCRTTSLQHHAKPSISLESQLSLRNSQKKRRFLSSGAA